MSAPTRALLKLFDDWHRWKFHGTPAVIVAGKDAKILARLYSSHGDLVDKLMEQFFRERGGFQQKAGFTVGVFASQCGRLLMERDQAKRRAGQFQ